VPATLCRTPERQASSRTCVDSIVGGRRSFGTSRRRGPSIARVLHTTRPTGADRSSVRPPPAARSRRGGRPLRTRGRPIAAWLRASPRASGRRDSRRAEALRAVRRLHGRGTGLNSEPSTGSALTPVAGLQCVIGSPPSATRTCRLYHGRALPGKVFMTNRYLRRPSVSTLRARE